MGWCIIPTAFQVLLYAPSLTNGTTNNAAAELPHNMSYTFSLWYLEPYARRNWLMSVVVIMYKVWESFKFTIYMSVIMKVALQSILPSSYYSINTPNRRTADTSTIWFESF